MVSQLSDFNLMKQIRVVAKEHGYFITECHGKKNGWNLYREVEKRHDGELHRNEYIGTRNTPVKLWKLLVEVTGFK